uniref:F-box domain-containing protein n=1 Tax=Steinernema glaseri TaxID=37863 RepID=A0A1I8ACM0_9BILA
MDRVPFAFRDHLCDVFSIVGLSEAQKLSSSYGKLARHLFEHRVRYTCRVEDGSQVLDYMQYLSSDKEVLTPEEIAAVPKKFVREVWIVLEDAEPESVSREVIRRFPYADYYNCFLESSSINESWVDLAYSMKRLGCVWFRRKLDTNALRLFQKLVTGQKIWSLGMHPDACEGDTMDILKSVLCQGQFEVLQIWHTEADRAWSNEPVRELLECVAGNCKGGVEQLEECLTQWTCGASGIEDVLEACSKEECHFVDEEYQSHTLQGKGRRLYVSFECDKDNGPTRQWRPASYDGQKELHWIRSTRQLYILFG